MISDITALGNSTELSATKGYYADVTNTVTFAYNDVPSGLKLPEGKDEKKPICDEIYDDLKALYNNGLSVDKYKSNSLTESFFKQLKKDNITKTELEILNFIDKAVKNALDNNKDVFTSNGSLSHKEGIGAMNLYLSPAVKTHSFKGMYNNGTEDVINYPIPPFSFGKVQADSKDQLLREGWATISVTTATK